MTTVRKQKRKRKRQMTRDDKINSGLDRAIKATPQEVKVHISLRLDSDIYMELHDRAEKGEAGGKYQVLLNQILRKSLFGSDRLKSVDDDDVLISRNDLLEYVEQVGFSKRSRK